VAGLAIARVNAISFELAALLALLSVVILILLRSDRMVRTVLLAMLVGMGWGSAALFRDACRVAVDESWLAGRQQIVAEVEKVDTTATYSRLRLIDVVRGDGVRLAGKMDVYLYGKDRQLSVSAGYLVQASVKLHLPRNRLNPGAFDYRAYCFDRHIALVGSASSVVVISSETSLLEQARQRIVAGLPDHGSGVIKAILLADRNDIPVSVQDSFAAAGAAHLLAISGLHVGMVAGWGFVIVWWLLTRREAWIVRLPVRKVALSVGLLMAVVYAAMAGWPVTAQRSVAMMAAAILAWWLRSRAEPINTMLAALMLLLLFDPAAVVSISLWLSFVAVAALLVRAGRGHAATERSVLSSAWKWAGNLFRVGMVATLATLPVIADIFGRIPTYSLVANLLLVPLYTLYVLPLSILGEISAIAGAGDVARWLFDVAATGIAYGNSFLATLKGWPAGNLWIPDVPLYAGLLYGAGIMVSALFLVRGEYVRLLLCSLFSLFIYLAIAIPEHEPESTQLTVWDVGQGASATLAMPDGRLMVIDVPGRYGSRYNGGTVIAAGLRTLGLVHADVLVLSHAQSDHAGGAGRLLDHLRDIGEVWLADVPANRRYRPMHEVIARVIKRGGAVRWLKQGERLAFGDAEVEVLWPPEGFDPINSNDASLVLSLRLPSGERLLFPADIERAGEAEMVRQGVVRHDLMLIPHHGSRTSSSRIWIDRIRPTVAIAQSGFGNRYGFPKADVMQRYRERGSQLFDSKHGAIMIRFDTTEHGMEIEQYRPDIKGKRETALQWWQRAL